jgi:alpha-tubulin suppressor-like RCC1 family protein
MRLRASLAIAKGIVVNLLTRITFIQHVFALAATAWLRRFGLGIACGLALASVATAQPTLINTTLPNAVHGESYSANLMVGGDPVPTSVTVTGLPTGLMATHNGSGSVAITGSTTQVGTFSATVTATNSGGTITPTVPITVVRYSKSVTAIAAGGSHSCALVNGGVQCWGENSNGQLGNNSYTNSQTPVQTIPTGGGATAVAASTSHSCAVVNGGVQCWGLNDDGQLGNNSRVTSLVPVQTIAAASNVTAVAAGPFNSCAVVGGGVQCWGNNSLGQLGIGSSSPRAFPVQAIAAGSGVTAVAVGGSHNCALANGGVRCWGNNVAGQLGNNSIIDSSFPVRAIAAGSGVTSLATGDGHSCVVINAGVQCWGHNLRGQLGNNSTAQSLVPVQIILAGGSATSVAASGDITCVVASGGAQCWGTTAFTQGGGGTDSLVPVQRVAAGSGVTAMAAGMTRPAGLNDGDLHLCALIGGGVQCWGDNGKGQLGNATFKQRLVAVQAIAAGSGVTAVAAGGAFNRQSHTCAVINGGVQCWGGNSDGQLGNGTRIDSAVPVQAIAAGSGVTGVATGGRHTCAMVGLGVRCWGDNSEGQLGNNSIIASLVPVQAIAPSGDDVHTITAGSLHSCATSSGGVKCWGQGTYGQLGNNSTAGSRVPVQAIPIRSSAQQVSAGSAHSCAVKIGNVVCWGYNFYGQLGNNSTTQSLVPVPLSVTGTHFFVPVATGSEHTCAGSVGDFLTGVGRGIQCWGSNNVGQLGNNSTAASLVPVQTLLTDNNWTIVASGDVHSCAAISGGVQCWGYNSNGQLGNNSTTISLVPTPAIVSGSNVTGLSASWGHTCAVINGGVQCWGNNTFGQLAEPLIGPARRVFPAIAFGDFALTASFSGTGAGSVSSSPAGVACTLTCVVPIAAGTEVTLTATAAAGSVFTGWSGGGCTGTAPCTVPLMAPTTVVATFTLNTYAVTTSVSANGGGTITCTPNPVGYGTNASCTATPNSGFTFASWSGDCTGAGACSLTNVMATKSVTANFNANQTIANFSVPPFYVVGAAPITLTATGGGSSSPVLFGMTSGAGICTLAGNQVTAVGAGTCTFTANQAAAPSYNVAPQVSASMTVLKASPTLALTGNGTSALGSNVTFTATLTGALAVTGSVQFLADTVAISGCGARPVASSAATCATTALASGARSITAVYSGDSNHQNATAPAVTHTVTGVAANLTFALQVPGAQSLAIGGTFAVNPLAVAGASSAPVVYSVAPAATCSISGTTITMNGLGSCAVTVNQAADGSNPAATPVTQTVTIVATLDIDRSVSSTKYHAHTDGLLIVRYLSGMTGAALTQGALGSTATRADPVAIKAHLDAIRSKLDIDGDGSFDPKTDGLLILRYLLGLRGTALTANALATVPQVPTRTLPVDIEAYIQGLMP